MQWFIHVFINRYTEATQVLEKTSEDSQDNHWRMTMTRQWNSSK